MINNIVLVGRTTKTIELKQNKNGTNYVQFTLAVNRPYKDEQGQQQADFINCVAWNKTAETIAKYVPKGTMIGVEGRLQVRNYENRSPALSSEALSYPQLVGNKAGIRQYLSEVLVNRFTFLESKKSSTIPDSVDLFNTQQSPTTETSNNPYDPNFSNPNYYSQGNDAGTQNYSNPFVTATTLAGGLHSTMTNSINSISVSDDDLPF